MLVKRRCLPHARSLPWRLDGRTFTRLGRLRGCAEAGLTTTAATSSGNLPVRPFETSPFAKPVSNKPGIA